MSLSARFKQEFDARVLTKGNGYFNQRRVRIAVANSSEILANVQGNGGDYVVALGLSEASDGVLKACCSCLYFEGSGCCKHIWATLLQAEPQLAAAPFPRAEIGRAHV